MNEGELSLLEVDGLSASYGNAKAIWDVSFTLKPGAGLGIVGRNGAGKSTLLRSISRVHRSITGRICFSGEEVTKRPPYYVARQGLSFVREAAPVFGQLTVKDHFELGVGLAHRRHAVAMDRKQLLAVFPRLEALQDRQAGLLSGGQRQMLALAVAVVSAPTLLLLDEPSAGLSPEVAAGIMASLRELRSTGLSLLIAEQNEDWLVGVADDVIALERGRIWQTAEANSGSEGSLQAH